MVTDSQKFIRKSTYLDSREHHIPTSLGAPPPPTKTDFPHKQKCKQFPTLLIFKKWNLKNSNITSFKS